MSTTAVQSPEAPARQRDGFAITAFLLSLLLLFPLQADMLAAALRNRRLVVAALVAAVCLSMAFTPFLLSWRRRRREPQSWGSRGYLIAAAIIPFSTCFSSERFLFISCSDDNAA
jgi:hypothetical protein